MSWTTFRRKAPKITIEPQNSVEFDSGLSSESDADSASLDDRDFSAKLSDKVRWVEHEAHVFDADAISGAAELNPRADRRLFVLQNPCAIRDCLVTH